MNETNHLIDATAQFGLIEACERAEDCRLWGSGMLTLTENGDKAMARVVLTAAGCDVCPNPCTTNTDIGLISVKETLLPAESPLFVTVERLRAAHAVADKVESIQKKNDTDADFFQFGSNLQ